VAPSKKSDQSTGDAATAGAASAEGAAGEVRTGTGETEPNPAVEAAGVEPAAVPFDLGGMPATGAGGDEGTREVRLFGQDTGEVTLSFDGGPRKVYEVKGGKITVPAHLAQRIATAIPGATLEEV
jgi:hypothetical protein